ncbi:restriction endonuclease subunit S [Pontibacter sp. JH31]|uniref:Restriction endonuclease subunit S n=1 Tax=Pontibacter aquaedesilientis TaxID=2766980 RepID=A0ABR7XKK8_9BACT|nr:restriction endonuclease subunit S [Pontibacter aquaedesilientis]MBD1398814.1 restriction endonuclease subunit S [Pontibacter aquaedesilientis]
MLLLEQFENLTLHPKNAARLKGLVLQLAVQGKLTENWRRQNPDVEPTTELMKRIEAEKLVQSKGKKLKDKNLKPISADEPSHDLPKSWLWCRLGEIIHISSGNGLTARDMAAEGTIPVYGGNGINGYHNTYNVEEQTIVIGRVGFYCGSIHLTQTKAWVTDNAFITTFSKQNIHRDFLVWLLKATNLKEDENATAQPVISGKKVYPILIALPPLAEQEAIVARVEVLMQKIEELEM